MLNYFVLAPAITVTLMVLIRLTNDLSPARDYRVAEVEQANQLGESRIVYKIQERKIFWWVDHESFQITLFVPLYKTPDEAEKEILRLKSRYK